MTRFNGDALIQSLDTLIDNDPTAARTTGSAKFSTWRPARSSTTAAAASC
ncbi:MAG: hypothetical protein R3C45_09345 [Phycisphaerales bacterium]